MLKSLELFGFKSFADRTVFEFAPGVTCVVGPNGSGKSNVVDAIKWILGDQSAKSLRGKEMADVIFNGAAGRKPNTFAEATLTFDNTSGVLPIDAAEVQVGRRLYRSGDSEYLLNRATVRLKDIRDLFIGSGAGTAAYSIIEQGRVDQILQGNPTTRRVVFEEAAGVSKYKARRADAERRLERVAQNLLRLTDIVDEVEAQLTSTRSQASKAARYREISTQLERSWTGLAADDYRNLSAKLANHEQSLESIAEEVHELQSSLQGIESKRAKTEEQATAIDEDLHQLERRAAAAREEIASLVSTIRHQSERDEELRSDVDQRRREQLSLARQVSLARRELAEAAETLQQVEAEFEEQRQEVVQREQQLQAAQHDLADSQEQVDAQRGKIERLREERAAHLEHLAGLRTERATLEQTLSDRQSRANASDAAWREAREELEAQQQKLAAANVEKTKAEQALRDLQDQHGELQNQRGDAAQRIVELRERRSAALARRAVLEELEQRQEGVAIGVRDILERAATSHYPPWNCVLGIVRDLLDVPLEFAPVIESALGQRAQLIAVTRLAPVLEYLQRGAAPIEGRVGFVELAAPARVRQGEAEVDSSTHVLDDIARASVETEIDLTNSEGVIGRADRFVQARERVGGLAERVLGDTWIVEGLHVAERLAKESAGTARFVTLQGEVLSSDGSLQVGVMPHESLIVSRKSELRHLKNEIRSIEKSLESSGQRQTILSQSLSQYESSLEEAARRLQECSEASTQAAALEAACRREAARLLAELESRTARVKQIEERQREVEAQIEEREAEVNRLDDEIVQLQETIEEQVDALAQRQTLLEEGFEAVNSQQLALAKHEERLSSLRQAHRRELDEHRRREERHQETVRQLETALAARRRVVMQILRAESEVANKFVVLEELSQQIRILRKERMQLRDVRSRLNAEVERLSKQRRELTDDQHGHEIEARDIRNQIDALEQRMFEEYQRPLDEIVASGVSAYRDLLAERYGNAGEEEVDGPEADEVIEGAEEVDVLETTEENEPPVEWMEDPPVSFDEVRAELEAGVDRLRRKIKMMGHVNTEALENLEELESRYAMLSSQLTDLTKAKTELEEIIRKINAESQRIFMETFVTIREHFQELFRKLFGGGDGDIILEDPDDVLECGIDIVARPPGKELRSISLLSGGEKTMTAVALLFAMFRSRPSPYCILDEVDAALDDANVDRYVGVLREFTEMTQFVVITHRKRTMTAADVMYGVTMEQAGVSKRLSVRFEEVTENGEIIQRGAA